jgi:acetyltransferase-like isoleucine patch superfamily enzyme
VQVGVHDTAIIEGVSLRGAVHDCYIGPHAVIGYDYEIARAQFYHVEQKPVSRFVDIGSGVFVGSHAIISAGVSLGENTVVEHQCFVGENTNIGKRCFIRYGAQVFRRVIIGDDCVVGGFLCNDSQLENNVDFFGRTVHRYLGRTRTVPEAAPLIREGAFVGFDALLIGPIAIGRKAIVKARATILNSVPDGAVVEAGETYRG